MSRSFLRFEDEEKEGQLGANKGFEVGGSKRNIWFIAFTSWLHLCRYVVSECKALKITTKKKVR